jgi:hypothetical protein
VYPLAAEIVEQAASWLHGALGEQMGYETALETAAELEAALGPRGKAGAKQKARKPTVAGLAAQQSDLASVVASLVTAVQELRSQPPLASPAPPAGPPPGLPLVAKAAGRDLSTPLGNGIGPGFLDKPADLAKLLGGPPAVRALGATAAGLPAERDEDAETAKAIAEGVLPPGPMTGDPLALAILSQSQALTALVTQLGQGAGDPMLDLAGSTVSTRGASARHRLQQELALKSGAFYNKIMGAAIARMLPATPAGSSPEQLVIQGYGMSRYLERYGGFSRHKELGLLAWQVSLALDSLAAGDLAGSKDILALLLLCLDQAAVDGGKLDLGWILTLQPDPPNSVFQELGTLPGTGLRSFSSLADQKWITTALAYTKELDTIAVRRAEAPRAKPSPQPPPRPSPAAPSEEPAPSKKQLRAQAWAKAKAAAK